MGDNGISKPVVEPILESIESGPKQRFPNQPEAKENSQHINEHKGSNGIVLQIMKQMMTELMPPRPGKIAPLRLILSNSRNFDNFRFGRQQNGAQSQVVVTIKCHMTHRHSEKPRIPKCFIWPLGFQMTTKRL